MRIFFLLFEIVTSENFDIKLMKILLCELGNIYISDSYQVKSVNSYMEMASVINYIRNITVMSCDGQLSNDQFIECYGNIGQVIYICILPQLLYFCP